MASTFSSLTELRESWEIIINSRCASAAAWCALAVIMRSRRALEVVLKKEEKVERKKLIHTAFCCCFIHIKYTQSGQQHRQRCDVRVKQQKSERRKTHSLSEERRRKDFSHFIDFLLGYPSFLPSCFFFVWRREKAQKFLAKALWGQWRLSALASHLHQRVRGVANLNIWRIRSENNT